MNARKFNAFVSVNAITSGRRSRTREAIGAVRHVYLGADDDGCALPSHVKERTGLPSPSYVLNSSPNHAHVFWRVEGFDRDSVERLQKQLARELQTDPAATPVTQNTRLPGFVNHKRAQPHLVPSGDWAEIATALQEQLGLKLESQRSLVDALVIKRVKRPAPDIHLPMAVVPPGARRRSRQGCVLAPRAPSVWRNAHRL